MLSVLLHRVILGNIITCSFYDFFPDISDYYDNQSVNYRFICLKGNYYIYCCFFFGLSSSSNGGAIFSDNSNSDLVYFVVEECIFTNCTVSSYGGAIYYSNYYGGNFAMSKICASYCYSSYTSSFSYLRTLKKGLCISNSISVSYSNHNGKSEHAIYFERGNQTHKLLNISHNTNDKYAAITSYNPNSLMMSHCNVQDNNATSYGIIYLYYSNQGDYLNYSNFIGNTQKIDNYGLIHNYNGYLSIINCIIMNNMVNGNCYTFYSSGNTIDVIDCYLQSDFRAYHASINNNRGPTLSTYNVFAYYHVSCLFVPSELPTSYVVQMTPSISPMNLPTFVPTISKAPTSTFSATNTLCLTRTFFPTNTFLPTCTSLPTQSQVATIIPYRTVFGMRFRNLVYGFCFVIIISIVSYTYCYMCQCRDRDIKTVTIPLVI